MWSRKQCFCWVLGFAFPKALTSFITTLLLVTPGYRSFYQPRCVMHHGNWQTAGEMLNKYRQILLMAAFWSLWNWIFHLLPSQNKWGPSGGVPMAAHLEASAGGTALSPAPLGGARRVLAGLFWSVMNGNVSCLEIGNAAGAQGWRMRYPAVSAASVKKPHSPQNPQNQTKKTPKQTKPESMFQLNI